MHSFGRQITKHLERARQQVATLIGADPSEILFTSGGTESNNTAIYGVTATEGAPRSIITSCVEHAAVQLPIRDCQAKGLTTLEIPVDGDGNLDLQQLKTALSSAPALVSLMWANNETGVIFPMDEIAHLVKAAGGILHSDAIQAIGKLPITVADIPVDLLSISGHKLHAPKGVGVLYVRKGTPLTPLLRGGRQEHGLRGGTENVPAIIGLGKACELAQKSLTSDPTRIATLRDQLETGILATCPDARINGVHAPRLPNTTNISFEFIDGEAILYHLSDIGIAASAGSACASGSLDPSHVIRAMGVPLTAAHGTVRFSLDHDTSDDDISYALKHIPAIIEQLRMLSPFVA